MDTFCLQSFDGTDAVFRTGCVLYNLLIGFRETVLLSCWFERQLRPCADLIPNARRLRVRFAVPTERAEFLHRLGTLSTGLPIAAQLNWDLAETKDARQAPPKAADLTVPAIQSTTYAHGASP